MKIIDPKQSYISPQEVRRVALALLLLPIVAFVTQNSTLAASGITSGGIESQIGTYTNSSSLGAPFASSTSPVSLRVNRTGILEILFAETTQDFLYDADGDELPDDWERSHGLSTSSSNAAEDADGDGFTNLEEYILGSSPTDADSTIRLTIHSSNGLLHPKIQSVQGRDYELLVSTDLSSFQSWITKSGTGSKITFVFDPESSAVQQNLQPSNPSSFFFKVIVSLSD